MSPSRRLPIALLSLVIVAGVWGYASGWFVPTASKIHELAPGVYFRKAQTEPTFTGCNQGWVVFEEFVLVIDANFPNQAEKVIAQIRQTTDKPIRYVFDTHHHGDHADGNMLYTKLGATAVASERSRPMFESKGIEGFESSQKTKPDEYGELKYEMPSMWFPRKLVIDDGTQRVELIYFGHGHTMGDAVAWLPKHGILFTGDACVNGAFNYMGDSDVGSWIAVLTDMQKLPVKTIAPGHGELASKELIEKQKRYFVELRAAVKQLIDDGKSLEEIKKSVELPWYKEWTGQDVQQRTENIEHIYQELTGRKKS